jgi:pyridoxal biosynthesis lyase PdxS
MLCNGVIMDVIDVEQARIAEDCGAIAVMALERVPSDIRRDGGVARMSDPKMIEEIKAAVSIPVMAKIRIGHLAEAQILEAIGIDFIDESEVLTPADPQFHVDKHPYRTPFVCGATNLGEALRRVHEGAAMIRTKGEAGTGNAKCAVASTSSKPFQTSRWLSARLSTGFRLSCCGRFAQLADCRSLILLPAESRLQPMQRSAGSSAPNLSLSAQGSLSLRAR